MGKKFLLAIASLIGVTDLTVGEPIADYEESSESLADKLAKLREVSYYTNQQIHALDDKTIIKYAQQAFRLDWDGELNDIRLSKNLRKRLSGEIDRRKHGFYEIQKVEDIYQNQFFLEAKRIARGNKYAENAFFIRLIAEDVEPNDRIAGAQTWYDFARTKLKENDPDGKDVFDMTKHQLEEAVRIFGRTPPTYTMLPEKGIMALTEYKNTEYANWIFDLAGGNGKSIGHPEYIANFLDGLKEKQRKNIEYTEKNLEHAKKELRRRPDAVYSKQHVADLEEYLEKLKSKEWLEDLTKTQKEKLDNIRVGVVTACIKYLQREDVFDNPEKQNAVKELLQGFALREEEDPLIRKTAQEALNKIEERERRDRIREQRGKRVQNNKFDETSFEEQDSKTEGPSALGVIVGLAVFGTGCVALWRSKAKQDSERENSTFLEK